MASSTTMPMARIMASKVSRLIVKPMSDRTAKVAIRDTGTVTAGTSVARRLPKNKNKTATTKTAVMARVLYTSRIDASMNTEVS